MRNLQPLLYGIVAAAIGYGACRLTCRTETQTAEIPPLTPDCMAWVEAEQKWKALHESDTKALRKRDVEIAELGKVIDKLFEERDGKSPLVGWAKSPDGEITLSKPAQPTDRVNLPNDASTWYTTLFLQPDWKSRPNEARAVANMDDKAFGRELKQTTHYRQWTVDQAEAKAYYKFVPQTPCLLIQTADGQIVYRECNPDLGKFPAGLAHQINKTIRRQRHGNQPLCPGPDCTPPKQEEKPNPSNEVVAGETAPKPEPKPDFMPAALAFAGAGAVTFAVKNGMLIHKARAS